MSLCLCYKSLFLCYYVQCKIKSIRMSNDYNGNQFIPVLEHFWQLPAGWNWFKLNLFELV